MGRDLQRERAKEVPRASCHYAVSACFSTVQQKGKENQLDGNRHPRAAPELQRHSQPRLETLAKFY